MKLGPRLVAAAMIATAAPAHAQITAPTRIELAYDGRLNALHLPGAAKVLELHVVEEAAPDAFDINGTAKSYGILRAFKRIDVQSSSHGRVEAGLPRPWLFNYTSADKDRVRHVSMTWNRDGVLVVPSQGDVGDPPPTTAQKLAAADPLTVLLRAAYAPSGDTLCEHNQPSYDGRELYEMQFYGSQPMALSDGRRAMGFTTAVRCSVRYVEIAGFKHKPGEKPGGGLKSYIHAEFGRYGANGPWVLMSMKADTILGYAVVELSKLHIDTP